MEPWNEERHFLSVGAAWRDCGQRVPGLLKDDDLMKARKAVQTCIFRMARQLNDPTVKAAWKSRAEIKRRVEKVAAKLAAERRFKGKFRLDQQQAAKKMPLPDSVLGGGQQRARLCF